MLGITASHYNTVSILPVSILPVSILPVQCNGTSKINALFSQSFTSNSSEICLLS